MNVDIQKLPKSEVKLIIEVPEDELQKFEAEAVEKIGQHVKIEGFRPGKASKQAVVNRVGEQAFKSEVMEIAIPKTYMKAVVDGGLKVVARPKITIISETPFRYEAQVAVLPDVTMKDYSKIKIKTEKIEVKDKEVDETIEQLRKYRSTFKKVDRKAQKGDRIEIDFEGFDENGVSLDKTKSANHPLIIGDGMMVPGFEDELEGMKEGETKEFTIKFPKDYRVKDFQDKKVKFKVEAKMVEEAETPELSEEFIEKITGKKQSVEEFKKEVKENIFKEKKSTAKTQRENELLEKLLEYAQCEIPDALTEEEIDFMIETLKADLERKGMKFEQYLDQLKNDGKDMTNIRKEYTPEAEKRVKLRLVLAHLFKEKNIEITESEIEEEIKRMTEFYPEAKRAEVLKHYGPDTARRNQLENRMRLDKFLEGSLA